MSETLGSRVKLVRSSLEMSQRVFAKTIGVSLGAVQSWERDRTSPNGAVLEAICRLGLDGHWLVTGEGPMWRLRTASDPQEGTGQNGGLALGAERAAQLEELQGSHLGEILLLSRRGAQLGQWGVLQALCAGPTEGMTLEELHKVVERVGRPTTPSDVAVDCRLLKLGGLIRSKVEGPEERFYLENTPTLQAKPQLDQLQAVWGAIQTLAEKISPRLADANQSAYVANIYLHVEDGLTTLARLRSTVRQELEASERETGDVVQIVIGMVTQVDD